LNKPAKVLEGFSYLFPGRTKSFTFLHKPHISKLKLLSVSIPLPSFVSSAFVQSYLVSQYRNIDEYACAYGRLAYNAVYLGPGILQTPAINLQDAIYGFAGRII
jgi:hypothetical protein